MIAELKCIVRQVELEELVILAPENERWDRDPRRRVRRSVLSQGTIIVQHPGQGAWARPRRQILIEITGFECIRPRAGLTSLRKTAKLKPLRMASGNQGN